MDIAGKNLKALIGGETRTGRSYPNSKGKCNSGKRSEEDPLMGSISLNK